MAAILTRHRRFLAALVLVVGACAHSGGDATTTNTLVTPGVTSTTASGDTTASTARSSGSGGGTTATTQRAGSATTTRAASSGDKGIAGAATGPVGAFAGVLLAPGQASNIVLDVLVQPGVSADADVINTLRQILAASSAKPVTVSGPRPLNSSTTTYDSDAVRRLADAQGKAQGAATAVVHLLYLKGAYSDDSVLGVTVRADTTAVFPDQITGATSPLVSRRRLEQAVDTHELGHVLGLVDLYLNDGRDDPDHPGHSTNPRSVMYWAVESDLVSQALGGPPPVDFDAADQSDLRKIHGGAAASGQ